MFIVQHLKCQVKPFSVNHNFRQFTQPSLYLCAREDYISNYRRPLRRLGQKILCTHNGSKVLLFWGLWWSPKN